MPRVSRPALFRERCSQPRLEATRSFVKLMFSRRACKDGAMTMMDEMCYSLPTFLVIGAQKCGTTWLARMMRQHPEVGVARMKEVHFFDQSENYERGIDWYQRQFLVPKGIKAVGEFTPNYLATVGDPGETVEDIAGRVHAALPGARFIAVLRSPVARAISAYRFCARVGWVRPGQRLSEVVNQFGITSMGRYDLHFDSWFRFYPRDRFLILIFEEHLADNNKQNTLSQIFRHIGVADGFVPDGLYEKYNVAGSNDFGPKTHERSEQVRIASAEWERAFPVTAAEHQYLQAVYEPHIAALGKLLGRSLPW